jgi:hypothetical protein
MSEAKGGAKIVLNLWLSIHFVQILFNSHKTISYATYSKLDLLSQKSMITGY